MIDKKCSKCEENKELDSFYKNKSREDGYSCYCKFCVNKKQKKYYKENINKKRKQFRKENPQKIKNKNKKYYKDNKKEILKQKKQYYKDNKDEILEYNRKYKNQRRKKDESFRILWNLRSRVQKAINENYKNSKTIELLGCTQEKFKKYLERQFTDEMSWDNYGTYWEIDHIIPLNTFDMTKEYEQKEAFFYTNCRPLEISDNRTRPKNGEDIV